MYTIKLQTEININIKTFPDYIQHNYKEKEKALKTIKALLLNGIYLEKISLYKDKDFMPIPNQTLKEAEWQKFLNDSVKLYLLSNMEKEEAEEKIETFEQFKNINEKRPRGQKADRITEAFLCWHCSKYNNLKLKIK